MVGWRRGDELLGRFTKQAEDAGAEDAEGFEPSGGREAEIAGKAGFPASGGEVAVVIGDDAARAGRVEVPGFGFTVKVPDGLGVVAITGEGQR